ncbi:DUF4279 domain-containing protein [Micromonospora sp. U56]|uniref:DUF4279 domain-containing protein n=1 Tax=Micromonospora sp. U56 TaxID=2824900 RepID=UPI001B37A204|nr:DUF4279 domain-containing protein [Micromonospora sp. U56]MBQ0892879.1 DUF4279 domain-containing protein [Micromonospora sp. U56]
MRVHQYVYFSLRSDYIPADEIAARLGTEADEIRVKASRRENPPAPRCHAWNVVCRDGGLTVDEQIDRVIDRLQPLTDQIAALAREIDASEGECRAATLQVVRYFNDDDGEEENPQPDGTDLVRLPGQHQLLGWHLDRRVLEFLHHTGAELDVDEYGY